MNDNETLTPIGNNLLLKMLAQRMSETIITPETAEKPSTIIAKVIAVGSRVKADIKPGDVVIGHKYMDKVHGPMDLHDDLFISPELEILGILEDYDGDR